MKEGLEGRGQFCWGWQGTYVAMETKDVIPDLDEH